MATHKDLSKWLTRQQSADAIGISKRELDRLVKAGKLRIAYRRVPEPAGRPGPGRSNMSGQH